MSTFTIDPQTTSRPTRLPRKQAKSGEGLTQFDSQDELAKIPVSAGLIVGFCIAVALSRTLWRAVRDQSHRSFDLCDSVAGSDDHLALGP